MEPLGLTYNARTNRNYLFLAISASLFCVGLALWSPIALGLILGAIFSGLFFSNCTFRWLVFPTVLILNQHIFTDSGVSFLFGGLFIQPIDWIAILLVLTVFFKQALTGQRVWMRTGLELPIGTFLTATALSLVKAPDLNAGIINWGHMALYFVAFYAMAADWRNVPPERIWRVYLFWAGLAAVSALWEFFVSGGARSLGFARLALNAVILPVLCFGLARLTLIGEKSRWVLIAALLVAAIASQTRGLWLSVGVLLVVWSFSGHFLKPIRAAAAGRAVSKAFKVIFLLFLIFLLMAPLLVKVEQRAEQLIQGGGTIYLRLFLWGVAFDLFVAHPVTGIGLGQFAGAMEQFPEMKNLAIFEWTHGLSAHNILLSFLAETGLVGTFAFLFLLVSVVRLARKGIQSARTLEELCWGWGFFMIFTVFAISFLFAGIWNYHFAFFLALAVLFIRKLVIPPERPNGR